MLTTRNIVSLSRLAVFRVRAVHTSTTLFVQSSRDPRFAQGTISKESNGHPNDPGAQAVQSGYEAARVNAASTDAACSLPGKRVANNSVGNPEGIGLVDQVGSQSFTAKGDKPWEDLGAQEQSSPPSFVAAVKKVLGMSTSADEMKSNREDRKPATGPGMAPNPGGRGAHTNATGKKEQNTYLKHKTGSPDSGKGAAGANPMLSPRNFEDKSKSTVVGQRRPFSMSARRDAEKAKHTAESYVKDVDTFPPTSAKTHQVDGSATGAEVLRPHELVNDKSFQSQTEMKEYETVNNKDPYDTPPDAGPGKGEKLRYGGIGVDGVGKSDPKEFEEGPEGSSKEGMK